MLSCAAGAQCGHLHEHHRNMDAFLSGSLLFPSFPFILLSSPPFASSSHLLFSLVAHLFLLFLFPLPLSLSPSPSLLLPLLFLCSIQIMPQRTHPEMKMHASSGYLLFGIKILSSIPLTPLSLLSLSPLSSLSFFSSSPLSLPCFTSHSPSPSPSPSLSLSSPSPSPSLSSLSPSPSPSLSSSQKKRKRSNDKFDFQLNSRVDVEK